MAMNTKTMTTQHILGMDQIHCRQNCYDCFHWDSLYQAASLHLRRTLEPYGQSGCADQLVLTSENSNKQNHTTTQCGLVPYEAAVFFISRS